MAGSYRHITNGTNEYIGIDLIENLGDAEEALSECYELIQELGGTREAIYEAEKRIRGRKIPGEEFPFTFERYWSED